ncbi:hypothetical protein [Streptomyces nojiriensis]|uniref:hypothetical protein n=1 Tax=Streptomyces nojiriensis TaxID=66374 RepID=UPI0035DDF537
MGAIVVGVALFSVGPFLHTSGPMAEARPTTAGWWCIGSGIFVLLTGLILMTVRDVRNAPAVPDEPYGYTCGFPPMG